MIEFMSDEARRYYAGGKRVMKDGVPCRVAAWAGRTPGKAFIKTAVAGQVEIGDWFDHGDSSLARFRFTPVEREPKNQAKPSKRTSYKVPTRYKSKWWTPAGLAYHPYEARNLTDTDAALESAKRAYHKGNAKPLRDWLANTADERRAYWAAYDAARATDEFVDWKIDSEAADDWRLAA